MRPARIAAIVMAGGEGSRLRPFTADCPKPALPFCGRYRIIDFVLSNLYNSLVPRVSVLLQYQPRLLIEHLASQWGAKSSGEGEFVRMLLPAMVGAPVFRGTADAVGRALHALDSSDIDLIAVFAADHVYRMDVRQMAAFHGRCDADVTIAALPVPLASARSFGVIATDKDARIRGFQEKPAYPQPMPADSSRAYASMGNYLFRPALLRKALAEAQDRGEHDFGMHVLPRLVDRMRVYAYDFATNSVPGVLDWEEPAYWRDVGTVDAYVEAQWDLLGPAPRLALDNPRWPIHGVLNAPATALSAGNDVVHSIIGPRARYHGSALRYCVVQNGAYIEPGVELERCVVMEGARISRGVRLSRSIVGAGSMLTRDTHYAPDADCKAVGLHSTPAGILIVPPGFANASMPMAVFA